MYHVFYVGVRPDRLRMEFFGWTGPAPGDSCPVCGFSTFDWCEDEAILTLIERFVRMGHAQWTADHGICRQCAELYADEERSESAALPNP